jgi:hypothetical protein
VTLKEGARDPLNPLDVAHGVGHLAARVQQVGEDLAGLVLWLG